MNTMNATGIGQLQQKLKFLLCSLFIVNIAHTHASSDRVDKIILSVQGQDSKDLGPNQSFSKAFKLSENQEKIELNLSSNSKSAAIATGELVLIGKKVFDLIKQGKPVASVSQIPAIDVLPKNLDIQSYDSSASLLLTDWKFKTSSTYTVDFQNVFGVSLAKFSFYLITAYGGQYEGKGAYIAGLKVIPERVDVHWGINFAANVEVISVVNAGSSTHPVAAVSLKVGFLYKNLIQSLQGAASFRVQGNGVLVKN